MSEKTEEFEEEVKIYPPKPGRPTKYIAEYDQVAGNLALAGFSDIDISEALGIAEQTFYDWQNRHPSFKKAISDGKKIAVGVVARSLFERAQGYTVKEKRVERDEVGNIIRTIETEKFIPPSDSSMAFFLKVKAPEIYADKAEVKHQIVAQSPDGSMTSEQARRVYEEMLG